MADSETCVLPLADAKWAATFAKGVSLEPPDAAAVPPPAAAAGSSGAGSSGASGAARKRDRVDPPMPVEEALSLCGRLLAKVLLDGDWYSVDDRLPDFVLEYLVTDNMTSLNTLDGALAALEQCRPGHARQYRELLARGAHEWPAIFGCDELRACDLAGCESWDEDERLTDANKASLVIDAVKHQLVSVRRQALIALKEGFQGADNCDRTLDGRPGPHAGQDNVYNFQLLLACMTPADLALRLRGRPVSGGDDVCARLRYRQQTEFAAPVGSTTQGMGPVTDAVYARVRGWLDALVRSLDPQTLGSLLYFMTGRKTVRASDFLDEEKDTITVLIWGPDRANIKDASRAGAGKVATVDGWLPTSSTCARQMQLPAYSSEAKPGAAARRAQADGGGRAAGPVRVWLRVDT